MVPIKTPRNVAMKVVERLRTPTKIFEATTIWM
jgi:hypothetical protein